MAEVKDRWPDRDDPKHFDVWGRRSKCFLADGRHVIILDNLLPFDGSQKHVSCHYVPPTGSTLPCKTSWSSQPSMLHIQVASKNRRTLSQPTVKSQGSQSSSPCHPHCGKLGMLLRGKNHNVSGSLWDWKIMMCSSALCREVSFVPCSTGGL